MSDPRRPAVAAGSFFVPGIARPQGSKRRGRHGQMLESSKYVAAWRGDVRILAKQAAPAPIRGAVRVQLEFFFPRPKRQRGVSVPELRTKRYVDVQPDLDKLTRAVLDAIAGVVYADDSQVGELAATKEYTDNEPGVAISWRPLVQPKGR